MCYIIKKKCLAKTTSTATMHSDVILRGNAVMILGTTAVVQIVAIDRRRRPGKVYRHTTEYNKKIANTKRIVKLGWIRRLSEI